MYSVVLAALGVGGTYPRCHNGTYPRQASALALLQKRQSTPSPRNKHVAAQVSQHYTEDAWEGTTRPIELYLVGSVETMER